MLQVFFQDLSFLSDDVIDTVYFFQLFFYSLTDSDVSYVIGQLVDVWEYSWLESSEGLVWKDLNLIENSQYYVGLRL